MNHSKSTHNQIQLAMQCVNSLKAIPKDLSEIKFLASNYIKSQEKEKQEKYTRSE